MNAIEEHIIKAVAEGKVTDATRAMATRYLDGKKRDAAAAAARLKSSTPSVRHAAARRREEDNAETNAKAQMHAEVFAWNILNTPGQFGSCDCGCGYLFKFAAEGECDHWIERSQGGEHTRENGWRLRYNPCHLAKTNNEVPANQRLNYGEGSGREYWNTMRRLYCERAGIPFVERRVR